MEGVGSRLMVQNPDPKPLNWCLVFSGAPSSLLNPARNSDTERIGLDRHQSPTVLLSGLLNLPWNPPKKEVLGFVFGLVICKHEKNFQNIFRSAHFEDSRLKFGSLGCLDF